MPDEAKVRAMMRASALSVANTEPHEVHGLLLRKHGYGMMMSNQRGSKMHEVCPFCGDSNPECMRTSGMFCKHRMRIMCPQCGCDTAWVFGDDPDEAVKKAWLKWDTRCHKDTAKYLANSLMAAYLPGECVNCQFYDYCEDGQDSRDCKVKYKELMEDYILEELDSVN